MTVCEAPSGGQVSPSPAGAGGVGLGGGVIVCPGVTIGDNCVIGAGSVVTKDIPASSLAVGNPARVLRQLDDSTFGPRTRSSRLRTTPRHTQD